MSCRASRCRSCRPARAVRRYRLHMWTLALALTASVACSPQEPTERSEGAAVVKSPESAWIDDVRRAHRLADEADQPPSRQHAVESLERALQEVPASDQPTTRWVRQDLIWRIAKLHLDAGDAEASLRWVARGLGEGRENSVAVANLLVVQGKSHEALGHAELAVSSYHDALVMNQALMEASLKGEGSQ